MTGLRQVFSLIRNEVGEQVMGMFEESDSGQWKEPVWNLVVAQRTVGRLLCFSRENKFEVSEMVALISYSTL